MWRSACVHDCTEKKMRRKDREATCEEIKISFSGKYMMDALRTIKSDNVILTFVGEVKPILLKEENNDELLCLILPIRTY